MSSRVLYGFIAAACLSGTAALSAQTPAQTPSPTAAIQPSSSPVITVTGCVQKENAILKGKSAAGETGMGDEFVLTNSKLSPGASPTDPPPASAEPPAKDPVGTSGSASNFGKVYRVTGDKESDLKSYVGQSVQITGMFKSEKDAKTELSTIGTSGRAAEELTTQNTPEITVVTVKAGTASCAAGGK